MTETSGSETPPPQLLEAIGNLAEFHREHEKFYSQAPLRQAVEVQAASRVLKALAGRWSAVVPAEHPAASPFAGAEDLNAPGLVAESGVLFMEGEAEPAEIKRLRRDLETLADDVEQTGEWLARRWSRPGRPPAPSPLIPCLPICSASDTGSSPTTGNQRASRR